MDMANFANCSLLKTKSENFLFLYMPLFFLAGSIFEFFFTHSSRHEFFLHNRALIVQTLGLGIAHNAFTFSIMFLNPVRKGLGGNQIPLFKTRYILFYVFCFIFTMIAYSSLGKPSATGPGPLFYYAILFWAFNWFHTIKQTHGWSLLINRQCAENTPDKATHISRIEKTERAFYSVFCLYSVLAQVAFSRIQKHFPEFLYIHIFVSLVLAGGILMQSLRYRGSLAGYKALFNLRLILFSMTPFSWWAAIGTSLCHNVEYWFIYKKMTSSSLEEAPATKRFDFIKYSTIWIVVVVALSLFKRFGGYEPLSNFSVENFPFLTLVLVSVSITITASHYLLDGVIFKFRDSKIRKNILPLLITKSQSNSPRLKEKIAG